MSTRFYKFCYILARPSLGIFHRLRFIGKENIPEGAALVCANHSSNIDPFFMEFAFGINGQVHIIAKAELFKIPLVAQIIRKLGMISVDRGMMDIETVKKTLKYLRNGDKVGIFPEAARLSSDDAAGAKAGAVKVAELTGVPVLPMFIPRKKPLFTRLTIHIGEPYYIEKTKQKRSPEEYRELAEALMERISGLGTAAATEYAQARDKPRKSN